MQPVAGLEIHIQLKTQTKAFSASPIDFGGKPNDRASAIDIGMPGTLPVVNKEMLKQAIILGSWLNAKTNQKISFARKHYFYPDLPKGYQITQDENPILVGGYLDFDLNGKTIRCQLHHAHLEEDAGKSVHGYQPGTSGVDLNRAGQPLLEIVTEPCLHSIEEIIAFLKHLHSIVTYLEICDGNMQEGSFRVDVNVSMRENSDQPLGTRVELKNMNSFKFIQKALEFEIDRQMSLIDDGKDVVQETRQFNEASGRTESMRGKESAHDYRYFKDPDLPSIWIDQAFIDDALSRLPESPSDRQSRYMELGVSKVDATIIAYNKHMGNYFDFLIENNIQPKPAANWLLGPMSELANKSNKSFDDLPGSSKHLEELLKALHDGTVSSKMAKEVLGFMWEEKKPASLVIEEKGLKQLSNEDDIRAILNQIIDKFPDQTNEYRSGKDKLFGFFVGQAMKATKGQANPNVLNKLLKECLK
ncbi:MAG: Asp-tRNA(Asn)/Glu-tRNA(Gln) amidotransferase subunit GatB [Pseudomonadota bacterium]|nr:Asp-tRNA(Asn)/Glu-tRNA(Gln) amidotransferase subunit GatB [Pseudomonadota bacterium]